MVIGTGTCSVHNNKQCYCVCNSPDFPYRYKNQNVPRSSTAKSDANVEITVTTDLYAQQWPDCHRSDLVQ
jgi:hypothetical protein